MAQHVRRAAHFLLLPELAHSPPNEAIVSALLELGYTVDLYAPGGQFSTAAYGKRVTAYPVTYGKRWLLHNAWHPRWRGYQLFSATSEDPLAVAGLLSWLHRRPFFALDDEIKSGSYYGNAPESWKRLCRWAIRRARLNIVNDPARIALLRDYAGLAETAPVLVYPGCFRQPPAPADRATLRRQWGFPEDALVIGVSGGFNETAGADWLLETFVRDSSIYLMVQALNLAPFARLLMQKLQGADRLYLESRRLDWQEAWASAAACDIGLAIYTSTGPQFQHMGIASNRLCMFLAMGVPVIGNRQSSYAFLETYDCGILVDSADEFAAAVAQIRSRLAAMKRNALRCAQEYIQAPERYEFLKQALAFVREPRN